MWTHLEWHRLIQQQEAIGQTVREQTSLSVHDNSKTKKTNVQEMDIYFKDHSWGSRLGKDGFRIMDLPYSNTEYDDPIWSFQ